MMRVLSLIAVGLGLLSSSAVFALAAPSPCTYWASPDAAPRQSSRVMLGSRREPIRVMDFWERAKPGDTLCLKRGVYREPSGMINPPRGLSGLPDAPITIRAEHDGEVLIDGGRTAGSSIRAPVRLRNNDYFILQGFDAANSNTAVIAIGGAWDKPIADAPMNRESWRPIRGVTVRRVVAWDANPRFEDYHACAASRDCSPNRRNGWNANYHVVDISAASGVLLEDVAAFGTGRKIFQVFLSQDVTIRRAWGRWEGNAATHTQTFSCAYRSYRSLCENVLATWTGEQQDDRIDVSRQLKSVLGMDWFSPNDRWQDASDPFDARLRVLGSLAYLKEGAALQPKSLIAFGYGKNQVLQDLVAYSKGLSGRGRAVNLTGCTGRVRCSWSEGRSPLEAPLIARKLTVLDQDARISIHSDWKRAPESEPPIREPSIPATPGVRDDAYGSLCHRYVDGVLTSQPLWPWPMSGRIRLATQYARGEGVNVEAEIESMLGPIPDDCRPPSEGGPADGSGNPGDAGQTSPAESSDAIRTDEGIEQGVRIDSTAGHDGEGT